MFSIKKIRLQRQVGDTSSTPSVGAHKAKLPTASTAFFFLLLKRLLLKQRLQCHSLTWEEKIRRLADSNVLLVFQKNLDLQFLFVFLLYVFTSASLAVHIRFTAWWAACVFVWTAQQQQDLQGCLCLHGLIMWELRMWLCCKASTGQDQLSQQHQHWYWSICGNFDRVLKCLIVSWSIKYVTSVKANDWQTQNERRRKITSQDCKFDYGLRLAETPGSTWESVSFIS